MFCSTAYDALPCPRQELRRRRTCQSPQHTYWCCTHANFAFAGIAYMPISQHTQCKRGRIRRESTVALGEEAGCILQVCFLSGPCRSYTALFRVFPIGSTCTSQRDGVEGSLYFQGVPVALQLPCMLNVESPQDRTCALIAPLCRERTQAPAAYTVCYAHLAECNGGLHNIGKPTRDIPVMHTRSGT